MLKMDLQLNKLKKVISKSKAQTFLLELPEGLKHKNEEIINKLENTKKKFVLLIDTTFGACDIYETDLKKSGCDAIIHFGHTKFILDKIKTKIIYWPCYYSFDKIDIEKTTKDIEKKFLNKKITIVGSIQYNKFILSLIKELKKHKKVKFISGMKTQRLNPCQILGCDSSSILAIKKKVDAIVYIGDGEFHFNALKNVLAYKYNFNGTFQLINTTKKTKIDALFISSKRIGIYVSSKLGQNKIKIAQRLEQKIKKIRKKVIIIYGNELNNNKLIGLGIDLLINTACPRITDDYKNYDMPVINPEEFEELYKKYYL